MVDSSTLVLVIFPVICVITPFTISFLKRFLAKRKRLQRGLIEISQSDVINFYKKQKGSNTYSRHLCRTCYDLDSLDQQSFSNRGYILRSGHFFKCYGCGSTITRLHPIYIFCCRSCGSKFHDNRHFSIPLTGQVSVVVGCRTDIGHFVTLKLLRAGAVVIGTTRYPERARALFEGYPDSKDWLTRLVIYEQPLDFAQSEMMPEITAFSQFLESRYGHVTNLLFCAAKAVSRAPFLQPKEVLHNGEQLNRYGDQAFKESGWNFTFQEIQQQELEESMRINAIAPTLTFQGLLPLMKKSRTIPSFVNVHANEGLLTVEHGDRHIHTSMAKLARHMLVRCLPLERLMTDNGLPFATHGVDPGLFSVEEYGEDGREWIIPPLDEIDAAASVLHPIFAKLESSKKTRKNYTETLY
jgi:NAD(P)-dependent dehydrogenase (short-subunit alcohol dehydrogenase family)